jgi:addiction module HigA family antidote
MTQSANIPHAGTRIKTEVIPQGMSVTDAAALMGCGRPALSNLLNGNSALSAEMAARLEKAFNYPREELLRMQANYEAAQAKKKTAPADTRAYVPPFLGITANQIEQWVTHNIHARARLSVFLRTLVHSTGRALTKVDFPGNDDAERPGWDGYIVSAEGTPWVPLGPSGWEFGVNEDVRTKAEGDFAKSVKAQSSEERDQTTFVFVTPRRWFGRSVWVAAAKAKGLWKDVRAYDASDLEQWLEQSLPAQAWLANEMHVPAQGVRSLDKCWMDWANVSAPPLSGALFASAIEATKRIVLSRLLKPSVGPTIIAADSIEEALAYLSQLFGERGGEELAAYRDRVLVFDKPGTLPTLAEGAQPFIPVAFTREVERELAPYAKSMHSIVVYPRNAANIEPDVVLEAVNYETFDNALEEMGKDRDEITRLTVESGRSLTVLRRRLADLPGVRTPEWAADHTIAARLIPFLFVGAWNSANGFDKICLSMIAGDRPYTELEKEFQALARLNDAPVWSIGEYRGVVSKLDLLYAIASVITPDDLSRYFSMARMVLSEDDPALDLDERERWAARLHGKTRESSAAFREGISESLVLLAVHGSSFFKTRLGVDPEMEARLVVRELLSTPLTTRVLEANDRDLPTYAEAAPDEFLSILERDLNTESPAVLGLLRPADAGPFGRPSRAGLLWALEGLSWNPETLSRAAFILARLAQVEIRDNWVNKPTHSLKAIFRAWMPQTAANLQGRIDVMKRLAERFPEIARKICLSQFGVDHDMGQYSHRPRWRADGYGFGEPFATWEPIIEFQREMVEMALGWKEHTLSTLCDLVERLHGLDEDYQARVWMLIEAWARDKATEAEKALLREKIRVSALSWRAATRTSKGGGAAATTNRAKEVYAGLEPSDLLNRHAWLFRDTWVEESADEVEDIENINFQERVERMNKLRTNAIREIRDQRGNAGVLELAVRGKASWHIGEIAARVLLSDFELRELLRLAFEPVRENRDGTYPYKALIAGAVRAISDEDKRELLLKSIGADVPEDHMARLLLLAPFGRRTWKLVDNLGEVAQAKYWNDVEPQWLPDSDAENNEGVERLLRAGRPRDALLCIRFYPERIDAEVLYRVLIGIAKGGQENSDKALLEYHYVDRAFKCLDASPSLSLDQKASLEFAFVEILARPWDKGKNSYGIPNLERYVEIHPELFVQAVAWVYKRKDEGVDPPEVHIPPEHLKVLTDRGYKLLDGMRYIPGHDDLGELSADRLATWIGTVRKACAELSRGEIADICIGKLLSHAPVGEDGAWPSEPVRRVLEETRSESMMRGAHTGVYNSRGVHSGGRGGDQERVLADKYRKWGEAIRFSHPYVSSKLLMELARTYDREADREDTEAGLRRRLH